MAIPQKKLKADLPYNPEIPLLSIYPKKIKIIHTYASVCLLYHLQYPYCGNCPSIDKWIKKMYVSKQNGILASHKKMKACHLGHLGQI